MPKESSPKQKKVYTTKGSINRSTLMPVQFKEGAKFYPKQADNLAASVSWFGSGFRVRKDIGVEVV